MSNFTEAVSSKFLKTIDSHSMICGVDNVVVGFSGGADSVCLLHLLHKFQSKFSYNLVAVHVNHGIRGDEAKRDANFAESFCKESNIPFKLIEIDCVKLSEETKDSLEEAGRKARYDAFNNLCKPCSKIATAHNQNDNAETLIFNLSRGISIKGASGIPYVRDNIIRPLLDCSREEIEGYCSENNLSFVTDSTNLSDDYTRNKIRHNILPVMNELNSDYLNKVTQFCNDCSDLNDFLEGFSQEKLEKATIKENCYDAKYIYSLNKAVATRVLVLSFSKYSSIALDRFQILSLYNLLSVGGRFQIKGEIFAEVKQGRLRYFSLSDASEPQESLIVSLPFDVQFCQFDIKAEYVENSKKINHLFLDNLMDCDKLEGNLILRTRLSGDKITLRKRNVTKTLKKLFCEENVPIEIRDNIPILCDDKGIVWVYGFGVDKRLEVTVNSNNIVSVRGKYNDRY